MMRIVFAVIAALVVAATPVYAGGSITMTLSTQDRQVRWYATGYLVEGMKLVATRTRTRLEGKISAVFDLNGTLLTINGKRQHQILAAYFASGRKSRFPHNWGGKRTAFLLSKQGETYKFETKLPGRPRGRVITVTRMRITTPQGRRWITVRDSWSQNNLVGLGVVFTGI